MVLFVVPAVPGRPETFEAGAVLNWFADVDGVRPCTADGKVAAAGCVRGWLVGSIDMTGWEDDGGTRERAGAVPIRLDIVEYNYKRGKGGRGNT